jgi:4-hydroxy-tetrahydrodipicolinate synthase
VGLRGIVPSLNTPFAADGAVDLESTGRLVDATVAAGCVGMLVLAVAAEGASLERAEKRALLGAILERTAGRIPVIASVTAPEQGERLALARAARELGAAGICCQAPVGVTAAEREARLAEVAGAGPALFMLQDLDWTGGGLPVEEIVRLTERLPTFRCLKVETVPAGPKYTRVLEATGGRLHVSGGWAVSQMLDGLARGVHAFMGTALDPVYVAIYRHYRAGRIEAARALFEAALPILAFANQHIDVSIRFLKRLRHAEGIFATDRCRPPVAELDPFQAREADRLVRRALALQASLGGVSEDPTSRSST